MRQRDHALMPLQAQARKIADVGAQALVGERGEHRFLVDDGVAREIEQHQRPCVTGEALGVDEVARLSAPSGTCSVTKSEPLITSSMDAARFTVAGRRHALSTVISGS